MLLSALALLVAAPTAPATAPHLRFGPITATYHARKGLYCIRSGWTTASLETNRRVRAGDCRTAADWRYRNIAFDAPVLQPRRERLSQQVAAR